MALISEFCQMGDCTHCMSYACKHNCPHPRRDRPPSDRLWPPPRPEAS